MAAQISVEEQAKGSGWKCRVTVTEGGSKTIHMVTVEKSYRDKLAGAGISAEQLVRKSFEYLLKREPKESILRSFNLTVISRYFPEYEQEISRTLAAKT